MSHRHHDLQGQKSRLLLSVRPSVCLFAHRVHSDIIREPKGLACPDLEGRFPTLDATHSFKVKRSPGPLMLTHRVPYLPNDKAYELQTW